MEDSLSEIMRAVGRLEATIEGLKEDIVDGKESRGRIHSKLEKIEEDVVIVGATAAQARDKANVVGDLVAQDVKPVTDEIKLMGLGALALLGFAFTLLGISLATVGSGFFRRSGGGCRVPRDARRAPARIGD